MNFQIKDSNGQINLTVEILGEEQHGSEWLKGLADFNLKRFKAKFSFSLMPGDLTTFFHELKNLNSTLKGEATFSNIEQNIKLVFPRMGQGILQ